MGEHTQHARGCLAVGHPDPPLPELQGPEAQGKVTPFLQRRYSRIVPRFAPGMVMEGATDPDEPVPDDFTVTIETGRRRRTRRMSRMSPGTSEEPAAGRMRSRIGAYGVAAHRHPQGRHHLRTGPLPAQLRQSREP